jgi:hypothetical protein
VVGTASGTQKITILNYGSADLEIGTLSVGGADAGEFELVGTADDCSGRTLPQGQTCTAKVRFRPGSVADRTAELMVPSNAPGAPHAVALAGTGV